MFDLSFIWAGLIAFAVLAYVVLDGFDLGVGILFLLVPERGDERDQMTNSVAPVCKDGNETWLVLGGGGLMAVFPLAYATVMPALYVPIVMLLGLIFRGVAFEFRFRTRRWRPVWDWGFCIGSTVAAFMQGISLGALVQGIKIADRQYAGGWWDWLTPFSVLCGVALVVGYALLGATWLNLKTVGPLQEKAKRPARCFAAASARSYDPRCERYGRRFLDPVYFTRWFQWPTAFFSAFVLLLLAVCGFGIWQGLNGRASTCSRSSARSRPASC